MEVVEDAGEYRHDARVHADHNLGQKTNPAENAEHGRELQCCVRAR